MISMTVDADRLFADLNKLANAVTRACVVVAVEQARETAGDVKTLTPVYTGRLSRTVRATPFAAGGEVHYGSDLPYAGKIERSQHPVKVGIQGAPERFRVKMEAAAAAAIASL